MDFDSSSCIYLILEGKVSLIVVSKTWNSWGPTQARLSHHVGCARITQAIVNLTSPPGQHRHHQQPTRLGQPTTTYSMHLPTFTALASAALAAAHSLTISIPSVPALQNPWTLPPTTHATLNSLSTRHSAPLTDRNTMTFHNLTAPGSYLLDIHCPSHAFIPFRVDVAADGSLYAWETYRGNDWENKGEAVPARDFGVRGGEAQHGFEARVAGAKGYYVERSKCMYRGVPNGHIPPARLCQRWRRECLRFQA